MVRSRISLIMSSRVLDEWETKGRTENLKSFHKLYLKWLFYNHGNKEPFERVLTLFNRKTITPLNECTFASQPNIISNLQVKVSWSGTNSPKKYHISKVSRNQPLSYPSNDAAAATDEVNLLLTWKPINPWTSVSYQYNHLATIFVSSIGLENIIAHIEALIKFIQQTLNDS